VSLATLRTWDVDLLGLPGPKELMAVAASIFKDSGALVTFGVADETLANFLAECATRYQPNAYHNFHHGVHVLQAASVLINGGTGAHAEPLTPLQSFALLVAAIGHDLEHPGVTNAFLVRSRAPLALLYNDKSVLESHHAATTFAVLSTPGCNLFASLSDAQAVEARGLVIAAILATDMAHHNPMVVELVEYGAAPAEKRMPTSEVLAAFCHVADLANVALHWELGARNWSARVATEATNEFLEMQRIGLSLPPYAQLTRLDDEQLAARQIVFSDGWVRPLYAAAAKLFPAVADRLAVIDANREACKLIKKEAVNRRLRTKITSVVKLGGASFKK